MKPLNNNQINQLLTLCEQVSTLILQHYGSATVTLKSDNSPVTQADLAASQLLEAQLPLIADYPVLSEENTPATPDWLQWETYWLIDPIDGTKHFINQTGEFCVCIALIHQHQAIFGLITQPTTQTTWYGQRGYYQRGDKQNHEYGHVIKVTPQTTQVLNAVIPTQATATLSGGYLSERLQTLLHSLGDYTWYQRGSALKYIDIIEGKATLYPKLGDTCEWDSAAGQCLLECSGGAVIRPDNAQPLCYGKKASLLNPHFIAYRGHTQAQINQLLQAYPR